MNIKELLIQLCDIQLEVKELEKKIEKLESKSHDIVSDSVDSTTKYFPIIKTHYKIKGLDQKIIKKIEYYKTILENRCEKLVDCQIKLEEFIDTIEISRMRRIISYRYINQYSWIKIAQLIGGNATEDSVRKEHDRFLEKNEVCPICPDKL